MEFSGSYNTLYREVIKPACEESGFAPHGRTNFGPGIILADIIRGIRQATVVIAEVTPVNANVFYEVGYARASRTPTILLALRSDERLPFDISGHAASSTTTQSAGSATCTQSYVVTLAAIT